MILTCEHGGNRVPGRYADLFASDEARAALESHRGWDPGALELARALRGTTGAPLLHATVTRLLVDLNRSPTNRSVFSELTRGLPPEERERFLLRYHEPYRCRVEEEVRSQVEAGRRHREPGAREGWGRPGPVIHVSVHSFTPVLDGRPRDVDVGLLYDPSRETERRFSRRWIRDLREALPDLRVRANEPYRGTSDGLTTTLRRRFDAASYVGVELEVSQGLVVRGAPGRRALHRLIADTLLSALDD